jgi:Tol biopolymer transport system component
MTDPQLHDRLHRAADPIDADPEARLDALHAGVRTHARRRRAAGLAAGVAVALLVSAVAWQMRPGGARVAGAGSTLSGTMAYSSYDFGNPTMSVRARTFGGSDTEIVAVINDSPVEFSPDGTQLAYAQRAGDGTAMTVANADGSNAHEVGQGLGAEQLSWSPDGTRLAFIAQPSGNVAGKDVSILDLATGDVTRLPGADGYWWQQIAWSPDGSQIALAGSLPKPDSANGIYLLPLDGGALTQLKTDLNWTEFMDWSPDGSQLAFSIRNVPFPADRADYEWDVAVINADGTGFSQLTDRPGWDNFPVWSPDGNWIAFSSDRDASATQQQANSDGNPNGTFGGVGIYVMHPDGSDVQPVLLAGDGALAVATDWRA